MMRKLIYLILFMFLILACSENEDLELIDIEKTSGTFVDSRDNQEYKWVKIGDQIWMAENLSYLPSVNLVKPDSTNLPHYYIYGYDGTDVNEAKANSNYAVYGVLYDWKAALDASPAGWHLPSDAEWKELEMELGMTLNQVDEYISTFDRGTNQGTQLKSTTGWQNDGNGTNIRGFSGLPGGCRFCTGNFSFDGSLGYWWSSTDTSKESAWCRGIRNNSSGVCRNSYFKANGFSVRCIKDGSTPKSSLTH